MAVYLALAVVLEITCAIGLIRTRRERNHDRRHRAAFIGFVAATVASGIWMISMAIISWLGLVRYRHSGPVSEDVVVVSSILQHIATIIAFGSGFFSAGRARIFLFCYAPMMFLLYILFAFGNFGS